MFTIPGKSSNQLPNLDKILQSSDSLKREKNDVQSTRQYATEAQVVLAKVVHVNEYNAGHDGFSKKLQIAVIKTMNNIMYQVLLYINKQVIVSVATINPEFSYNVKTNDCIYEDDKKCLWSIKFDNLTDSIEFSREICLCKFLSDYDKQKKSVVFQDLIKSNEEDKVKEGDVVKLNYSIVTNFSQPLRIPLVLDQQIVVTVTSDDTWEKYLCEANIKSRRIMILPPSKQISLGPGFPKDKEVILEVEIVEIQNSTNHASTPFVPFNVKNSNDKASLLSRMAKMGHLIIPNASSTDSDDSDIVEEQKHFGYHKAVQQSQLIKTDVSPTVNQKSSKIGNNKLLKRNSSTPPVSQTITSPTLKQPSYNAINPDLNVFLSEIRTQNAEIRMGMAKIADNVQKILDKFHVFELQNAVSPTNNTTLEALKLILEVNSNVLQNTHPIIVNNNLESEINNLKKIIEEKDDQLKKNEESLKYMQQNMNEKKILELIDSVLNKKISEINFEGCDNEECKLKVKHNKLPNESSNIDVHKTTKDNNRTIKKIMDRFYKEISDEFTEETYEGTVINQIISHTIKKVTYEVLNGNLNNKNNILTNANEDIAMSSTSGITQCSRINVDAIPLVKNEITSSSLPQSES